MPGVPQPIIVGLGNPGPRYVGTRHNVGFAVADVLAALSGTQDLKVALEQADKCAIDGIAEKLILPWRKSGKTFETDFIFDEYRATILKPQTFMNLSGEAVQPILAFRKVALSSVIAIHDEIDLPVGAVKVKFGGGEAGHNGLRSLAQHCGGRDFLRVRIGVGRPAGESEQAVSDYVLGRYLKEELGLIERAIVKAVDAVLGIMSEGLESTQNRINR